MKNRRLAGPVFAGVLVIATLVQVAALSLRGMSDVPVFREWAVSAVRYGLLNAYAAPDPEPSDYSRPDYPPLGVTLLTAAALVADVATGGVKPDSRPFTFLIKLTLLTANLAVSILLLWLAWWQTRDPMKAGFWALAYWANPAFVVNGAVLGYLDPPCILMGLLALVSASTRHFGAAAVCAVIAAMIKPQGIFFLLPVMSAAWGSRRFVTTAAAAGLTGSAILAPFIAAGGPDAFVQAMAGNVFDRALSGDALNFWWLVTVAIHSVEHGWNVFNTPLMWMPKWHFAAVTGIEPRVAMGLVVVGVAAWLGWRVRGVVRLPALAAYLALVIHVYFVLAISVHENHQVYVVALLLLVAPSEPTYRRLTAVLSLLVASNMLLFYGLGEDFADLPHTGLFIVVTTVLSIVNVLLLAYHARLFRSAQFALPTPNSARPPETNRARKMPRLRKRTSPAGSTSRNPAARS